MKATGEVMAIDRTFGAALNKALRGLEQAGAGPLAEDPAWTPAFDYLAAVYAGRSATPDEDPIRWIDERGEACESTRFAQRSAAPIVLRQFVAPSDSRLWRVLGLLRRGVPQDAIRAATGISSWFLASRTPPRAARRLRHTDPAVAEADLEQLRILAPDSAAARMEPQEYLDHTAAALQGWWAAVLEPLWDRVDAIQRADIAHHQSALAAGRAGRDHARAAPRAQLRRRDLRVDLGEGEVAAEVVRPGHLVRAVGVPLAVGRARHPRDRPARRVVRRARGRAGVAAAGPRGAHRAAGPPRSVPGTDPRVPRRAALHDQPVAVAGPLAQHRERAPVGAGRRPACWSHGATGSGCSTGEPWSATCSSTARAPPSSPASRLTSSYLRADSGFGVTMLFSSKCIGSV